MTTESEMTFQALCETKGISLERIEREAGKTPDYFIDIEGIRVVIEIKEFEADSRKDDTVREFSENPSRIHISSVTPGNAVRRKIKKAGPQIRQKTGGTLPSMLVLYNRRLLENPANAYQIRVGMYGFDSVVFAVPDDMSVAPHAIDRKFGGSRQMTETCNTSISAVGVLSHDETGSTHFVVYHNIYSAIPLSSDSLRAVVSRQFVLEPKAQGQVQGWKEVR